VSSFCADLRRWRAGGEVHQHRATGERCAARRAPGNRRPPRAAACVGMPSRGVCAAEYRAGASWTRGPKRACARQALQDAGCFAVVLECRPAVVAAAATSQLDIPTIGIGAGPHCSGQVRRRGPTRALLPSLEARALSGVP